MRRLAVAIGCAIAVAVSVGAGTASAQGSFSFTPYGGIYVPTRNTFAGVGGDIKRNNSFIGGARLTFWGARVAGVEFTGGYSPAKTTVAGATVNASSNTKVFVGSAKLMLGVSPASSKTGIFLGLGPAIIRRGTDVLREDGSRTNLAGVAGVGVRVPLGGKVGLRFDVEDYMYGGDFDGSKKFQNDLVLAAGLSFGM